MMVLNLDLGYRPPTQSGHFFRTTISGREGLWNGLRDIQCDAAEELVLIFTVKKLFQIVVYGPR